MTGPRDHRPALAFLAGWLLASTTSAVLIALEVHWRNALPVLTFITVAVCGAVATHWFLPPRR